MASGRSFCCARRDCRKRATPPSFRFLGRKVYLGAVVVLIAALRCGPTPARMRHLAELVGVNRRTVVRWRLWWCEELPATPFWRAASGTLLPPVQRSELPAALLERFAGGAQERLLGLLRFILPITTGSAMAQVFEAGERPAEDAHGGRLTAVLWCAHAGGKGA